MRREVTREDAERAIVDGVELHGVYLAALVSDGLVVIGSPSEFMVASFELAGRVRLNQKTSTPISQWPIAHIRLPRLDANG